MASAVGSVRAPTISGDARNVRDFYEKYVDIIDASGTQTGHDIPANNEKKQWPSSAQPNTNVDSRRRPALFSLWQKLNVTTLTLVAAFLWCLYCDVSSIWGIFYLIHVADFSDVIQLVWVVSLGALVYLMNGFLVLTFCVISGSRASPFLAQIACGTCSDEQDEKAEDSDAVSKPVVVDDDSDSGWLEACTSPKAIATLMKIQLVVLFLAVWPLALALNIGLLICGGVIRRGDGFDEEDILVDVSGAGTRAPAPASTRPYGQCKSTSEKGPLLGRRLTAAEIVAIENDLAAKEVRRTCKRPMVEQKPYAPVKQ
ncbi:hypothetical protein CORC01_03697 [Colletotrichum orchidophilum]|uniref:Uncharacterized protein n=1 Tax=Colletotrichum orchidophilum TaxID=1209926 RepID=A0A1G4BHI7_9PEZI|nr:uncharacterized protein CORC01_03697 [Colletotrichum orchidophilum]OHF00869.1 hypothetical protein CORC01_03697 [Colletotrichum orchidophilum]